ncbi:MAG: DinB family protein [Acidobacteria bacterium]|nr:DinB family protein [Acidobacteriota bacterium]
MSTTATAPNPAVAQLLQSLDHEHNTTMRVLKAVPADKLDFKPHERNMSAGELAWHIAYSQYGLAQIVATAAFEGYQQPPAPATLDEIVTGGESYYQKTREVLSSLTPEQLSASIPLPGGRSIPAAALMWSGVLFHQIHHRGQLSVYIRMAGGKVPSIYGPSGDDNPFA